MTVFPNLFATGGIDLNSKANFTYDLPIGKGHRLFSSPNRALGAFVNGWQTASAFTWQSGNPFSILSEWPSFNRGGTRYANDTAVVTLTHQQISGDLGVFVQPGGIVNEVNLILNKRLRLEIWPRFCRRQVETTRVTQHWRNVVE